MSATTTVTVAYILLRLHSETLTVPELEALAAFHRQRLERKERAFVRRPASCLPITLPSVQRHCRRAVPALSNRKLRGTLRQRRCSNLPYDLLVDYGGNQLSTDTSQFQRLVADWGSSTFQLYGRPPIIIKIGIERVGLSALSHSLTW